MIRAHHRYIPLHIIICNVYIHMYIYIYIYMRTQIYVHYIHTHACAQAERGQCENKKRSTFTIIILLLFTLRRGVTSKLIPSIWRLNSILNRWQTIVSFLCHHCFIYKVSYVTKIYENFSLHKMNVRTICLHLSLLYFDRSTFSVLRSFMLQCTCQFWVNLYLWKIFRFSKKRNNLYEISFHCICDLDNFTMSQCNQRCTDWVYIVFSRDRIFLVIGVWATRMV